MRDHRLFSLQALIYQLEFAHELRKQSSGPGKILGSPECLELNTELTHFSYAQVAACAIQVVGHSRQRPCIPLLERIL